MIPLTDYRHRPALLADFLPWAALIAPGVVLNKDGSFQRTARFRGPDLDSATPQALIVSTARLNNALKRLGSGWVLFVEAQRRPAPDYPASVFPEALSWLVDQERRAAFVAEGAHFESDYHFTLVYLPPPEHHARLARWMIESPDPQAMQWPDQLAAFVTDTDRFLLLLDGLLPELAWLSDEATLTYLHASISSHPHRIAVPEVPFHLDALLPDVPLSGGLAPCLGDDALRVLTIRGFPASTWPGLLDELNRLNFSYRWVTRFICLDKAAAERELVKLRRHWFAKRKGLIAVVREMLSQQESPLVDSDADNKTADADAALQELGSDDVSFGYVTATLVVRDKDTTQADENLKAAERLIQGRGFVTMPETLNAVEAWLSSIPGQVYANVRQPLISTLNLAHLLPFSAAWSGPSSNAHLHGPPLTVTRTAGATPFRLVTHVGDVGHALVVGPTGAGKSVLLALLALQFRRYAGSRIFIFDKGRSLRATVLGLNGEHYDLGGDASIAFQPLADIPEEGDRAWAAEWLGGLLQHEHVEVTPEVKSALWTALNSLTSAPQHERTLTGLSGLLPSQHLRLSLEPYTLQGAHGRLLDADHDRLGAADVQCFEMEALMHTRSAVLPVLTYLFHRLEARFDGAPTLLILDEAWLFLDDPLFAGRIREWLKTLRKKNVAVLFATQSLADIQTSAIAPALIESCPTRIFLPSAQALESQLRSVYASFGLNDRQIELIARATPKREYYFQSPDGARLFELNLGSIALAFAGAGRPEDQQAMTAVQAAQGQMTRDTFLSAWLRQRGLAWAADLAQNFPSHEASRS